MYFTGLQNVSHFKYYPKSNFRKKVFVKLNDFKNHRDKQLWNTTGLIRFLVYFTTWQTSYPSPLPQKTSCENQASDKDSSLMQFRGKGKARNFFGQRPSHSPLRLLCFMDRKLLPGKARCLEWVLSALQPPERVEAIYCHLLLPTATACSLAATGHPLIILPTQCSAWGTGWFSLHWKGKGSKWAEKLLQLLHDDTKKAEKKKVFRNKDGEAGGKCQVRWGIFE